MASPPLPVDAASVPAVSSAPAVSEFSRAACWTLGVSVVTLALAYGVYYAYSVFLVALLREFGWSRSVLAGAFSIFSLVHGAANPVLGWIGDRIGPRRLIMAGGALLGAALWVDSLIESRCQMVGDRFRGAHFGAIFGVSQIGSALGTALGPWLAGWTFDVTGSYAMPFTLAAVTAGAAAVAVTLSRRFPAPRRP